MKNYIQIYDTTLRDGEQAPGFRMNSEQKLEIARALEKLGVDCIEAGFPVSSKGDFNSVRRIAEEIKGTEISGLARCVEKDIVAAGEALEPAIKRGKGKIHVFVATSAIHRESKFGKSKEDVKQMAVNGVKKAKEFTPYVEFSCEDFGRTEIPYTIDVVKAAIEAGATTINLPDTVGYRFPTEIQEMFRKVIDEAGNGNAIFSIHAHDDLGMASANSLYAIKGGARQVEVTVNGIGERAGNTALEEIVAALTERQEFFNGLRTGIKTELIVPTSKLVSAITGQSPQLNKAITGGNAFRHSSGIHSHGVLKDRRTYEWIEAERYGSKSELPLTARSGKHQVEAILNQKGVSYSPNEIGNIMERFKNIADSLNDVNDDALVMAVRGDSEIPEYYKLLKFRPWFDGVGHAEVEMLAGEGRVSAVGQGNGMINAAENAIKKVTGMDLVIDDYSSKALSRGGEAKGIESVRVRNNGFTVRGTGISEDVVYGTAKAIVDAHNRMRYVLDNGR